MIIEFSRGRLVVTSHQILVKLSQQVTLQAHSDAVRLFRGNNVIAAQGGDCVWSLPLDNEQQLISLADALAIAIEG